MDIAQFRIAFPEFADSALYPDTIIIEWSTLGEKLNDPNVFGDCWTKAVQLYTAHYISLQSKNIKTSNYGGTPGLDGGSVSMKELGTGQVQYDTQDSSMTGAGQFNQTLYGRQYVELRNIFGQGCIQIC